MILPILKIGDPILRMKCQSVPLEDISSDEIQSFIDDLIETKRDANGAGIAAPQVGKLLRIFVVENTNNPRYSYKPNYPLTVLINPEISFLTDKRFINAEGCLSIPDFRGTLTRCPEIRVRSLDRFGKPLDFEVRGVSAGIFQHENDHLDGIMYLDRMQDLMTLSTLEEFKKHQEETFKQKVSELVERYGS